MGPGRRGGASRAGGGSLGWWFVMMGRGPVGGWWMRSRLGDDMMCTARCCALVGGWTAGLDPRVGDQRRGDDGLEAAVAGDRRPNP